MTEQEINIAIAKALGWKDVHFSENWGDVVIGTLHDVGGPNYAKIPDCFNDLNEMHRAWQTLTLAQKRQFETELYKVIIGDGDYNRNDDAMHITNAKARHRAEAFLRTLGLWEEQPNKTKI